MPLTRLFPTVSILLAVLGGPAVGQSGKTAPAATTLPPVTAEPAATTAIYGDWVFRCTRTGDGDAAQRVCEVAQTLQLQDQKQPIAQLAFSKVTAGDLFKLTIALPTNISFPSSVKLGLGATDQAPVDLPWRRCMPGLCMADAVPQVDALKKIRSASEPGRLSFKDSAGQDIALPVSFRGLQQALDALAKG